MEKLTCTQAKQIDLVDYLQSLGYSPVKIRGNDYWYLSPLREEKTASFKIDRRLNLWYDHGTGQGGDLIDFGTLYHNYSISELLTRLSRQLPTPSLSFQPPTAPDGKQPTPVPFAGEKKEAEGGKITIVSRRALADKSLLDYLESRCIPLEIATPFCEEVDFLLYEKRQKAIGFANSVGGHELRSKHFKGSSSPKAVTFIDNHTESLSVFEGFFNFLSYVSLYGKHEQPLTNYLVLNSLSFFNRSLPLMQRYKNISLYLDRDAAGMKCTEQVLQISYRFKDNSYLYENYKDLNQFLISNPPQKQEEALKTSQAKEISEQKKAPREQLPFNRKGRSI